MAWRSGSWFGLPEFGVTEKISDIFGSPRDPQTGGSQLARRGSWFGLPDFGITEKISDIFGATRDSNTEDYQLREKDKSPPYQPPETQEQPSQPQQPSRPQQPSQPQQSPQETLRQPSAPSYEDILREQYNQVSAELDRIINFLPEQQKKLEDRIGQIASSQTQEVERAREAELARFPSYREQVERRQASTLEDLATNLRNILQAGNIFLGTRKAGDSSASQMFSFALAQEANRQRANIRNQANQMLNEINLKEQDVRNAANEQINAINTWKATQLANIANEFEANRRNLMREKANVRARAVETWLSYLSNIDQQARAWEAMVVNWGRERLRQLNDYKIQLQQAANFSPRDIVYEELQFNPFTRETGYVPPYNPYAVRRRILEENKLTSF